MKTKFTHRVLTVLSLLLFSGVLLMAQNKEKDAKADREAQLKEEQAIKQQMLEQQKKLQEMELEFQAKNKKMELEAKQKMLEQQHKMQQLEHEYQMKQRELEREARENYTRARTFARGSGVYTSDGEYIVLPGSDVGSQSQLTLRNTFQGGSDQSSGEFDVDRDTRRIRCLINGKVKSGTITIILSYPDGKVFKKLSINKSAEVSFSQSLNINQEDPDKYIGTWKYEIKSDKAEGNYVLQFSTS